MTYSERYRLKRAAWDAKSLTSKKEPAVAQPLAVETVATPARRRPKDTPGPAVRPSNPRSRPATTFMSGRRQKGFLTIAGKDPSYYGNWYVYEKTDDGTKRRARTKVLGRCAEITEAQARIRLADHLERVSAPLALVNAQPSAVVTGAFGSIPDECHFHKKGAMGELVVAADLLSKGCEVYRSLSHSASCDMLVIHQGSILRVEVKVADRNESGSYSRNLRLKRGNYDVLAVVSRDFRRIDYVGGFESSGITAEVSA